MIGTQRIRHVLETIAASAATGYPLSAQLIAPSDAGKTALLLSALPHSARVINDMTYASLLSMLEQDTSEDTRQRWVVIPDLNTVISHKPAVAQLTMSVLLSFLGEGVTEIPGLDGSPKMKAKAEQLLKRGVSIALLTAITPHMFFSHRGKWRATGLLRRLVPIFYTYSAETAQSIQVSIQNGQDATSYTHTHLPAYPHTRRSIVIPTGIRKQLKQLSEVVTHDQLIWSTGQTERSKKINALDFPFTVQKTLRTFARAHAILKKRRSVTTADMDATEDFAKFVRYDRPERL